MDLEKFYNTVEIPKVRLKITEFKVELGNHGKCLRLSYLYDRLIELDLELIEKQKAYQRSIEQDRSYIERAFIASYIPDIEKEIKKLEREIDFIVKSATGKVIENGITPEMIERARGYPIENLISVRCGMALCPFHDDKNPSMDVRNNFFYCYACGAKGDVLDFVMKRDGLTFPEAVKNLNQC